MTHRLGVDVGGTFTDLLLIDEETGKTYREKTASTPDDQSVGVLRGIERVCQTAGVELSDLRSILHGTTVATNAVLEGKGSKVGLVTTKGFRQVLQIARSYVPGGLAGWIIWPKPEPLADLEDTVEVSERIGSDGEIVQALDEEDVRHQLGKLRASGVEALSVSLISSYANGAHERRVAEIAAEELPGVKVSLSSNVLPELREYERTLTTVANAFVQPRVASYIEHLETRLAEAGAVGRLYVLRSDGGLASGKLAQENPVSMLMSGPVGGVTGAVWVAEQAGIKNFMTLDMGGTSTDVALVQDLTPRIGRETSVGDLTVRATSVDVRTIGAGGGSIAHVPELTQALRVGPQSAGADPGPAAYGRGGSDPTVTDANVVLGYLPTELAGGELVLDEEAAEAAVKSIADAAGLESTEAAAEGIYDIVNENMLGALRLVSVQQGFDPREFALIAYGGAGPLHGNALGRLTGSWPVIIPPSPGVLTALGDATTGLRDQSVRSFVRTFSQMTEARLREVLDELGDEVRESLTEQGVAHEDQTVKFGADLRYHGQGFEIPVEIDDAAFNGEGGALAWLQKQFDAEHERLFSFLLHNEHELVTVRATGTGPRPAVAEMMLPAGGTDPSGAQIGSHTIRADGELVEALLYSRQKLAAGNVVTGPAIITEMDSTTLVLPDHAATVHSTGSLLIRPIDESNQEN